MSPDTPACLAYLSGLSLPARNKETGKDSSRVILNGDEGNRYNCNCHAGKESASSVRTSG